MSKQTIGIGATPDDGTGDAVRVAFQKVIQNFDEVYAGHELDAISATVVANVVDYVVADVADWPPLTRDGWLHDSHRSWNTETLSTATRGSKLTGPAKMLVVGELSKISVLDMTNPNLPLHKSWVVSGLTSIKVLAGSIVYGGSGGLYFIDLLTDEVYRYDVTNMSRADQNSATYDQLTATWITLATTPIVSSTINDVSISTLLSAVQDINGTPKQTSVVATPTGGSWVTDSGSIWDATGATSLVSVDIDTHGRTLFASVSKVYIYNVVPTNNIALTAADYIFDTVGTVGPHIDGIISSVLWAGDEIIVGTTTGLFRILYNEATPTASAVEKITSVFSSGWQVGDVQACIVGGIASITDVSVKTLAVPALTSPTYTVVGQKYTFQDTADIAITLGAAITNGSISWVELVAGVFHHYSSDVDNTGATLATGTIDGVPGVPSTSVTVSGGTSLLISANAVVDVVTPSTTNPSATQRQFMSAKTLPLYKTGTLSLLTTDAITDLSYNKKLDILSVQTAATYDYLKDSQVVKRGVVLTDVTDLGFERVQVNGTTDIRVTSPSKSIRDLLLEALSNDVISVAGKKGVIEFIVADIKDSGTAATKNIPASADASISEVVMGNDSRLSDPRPPIGHTHAVADISGAGTVVSFNVPATGDAAPAEVVMGDDSRILRIWKVVSGNYTAVAGDRLILEAQPSTAAVLLHMDGADTGTTFTDSAVGAKVFTANGNAQTSTTLPKFGTASALFDGTGDWIDTPDHADFGMGTGDFTIETWMKLSVIGGVQYLFGQGDTSGLNTSAYAQIEAGNAVSLRMFDTSGTQHALTSAGTITDTTWHHLAWVRSAGVIKLYIDGVADANTLATSADMRHTPYKFAIGRLGELTFSTFNGRIDEFRWLKGTAAYTANFTPPTAAFDVPGVGGPFTVTLPATASLSDSIKFIDRYGALASTNVTISANGNNIMGLPEDMILNIDNASGELIAVSPTDWRLF